MWKNVQAAFEYCFQQLLNQTGKANAVIMEIMDFASSDSKATVIIARLALEMRLEMRLAGKQINIGGWGGWHKHDP